MLTLVEPARAAPASPSFTLAYAAPDGCPARATFVASILERAPGSIETRSEPELVFDVRVVPEGELTRGTLTVLFAHGEHFEREVPPARCADVTTSMAIIAGLLLAGALLPEPATKVAPPARKPPTSVPSPPPPSAASRPEPAPEPLAVRGAQTERTRFRIGAFMHAALELGALPFPGVGFDAGAEAGLERPSVIAPSLRAGFAYSASKASRAPDGAGIFRLRALAVRACVLKLELAESFAVHACALIDAGRLTVSGRSTTNPLERHMTWLALGPAGRIEARLGRVVALELEAAAFGLVQHDEFVLEPADVKLYEIPAFSGRIALGVVACVP